MKVTEVKTFLVHAVRQNWLFVKVTTDTGLTGWGEPNRKAKHIAMGEIDYRDDRGKQRGDA